MILCNWGLALNQSTVLHFHALNRAAKILFAVVLNFRLYL